MVSLIQQKFLRLTGKAKTIQALAKKIYAEREAKYAFSNLLAPPILVYQMGKVGSSSVYQTLKEAKFRNPVYHLHFLSDDLPKHRETHEKAGVFPLPFHIYLGEAMRKYMVKNPNQTYKIISLVRDPIAFAVSNLFQNPYFAKENLSADNTMIDPEKACRYMGQELSKTETFQYLEEWFDRELKQVFGIDVFDKPFPVDTGYAVYKKGNAEALVIRLEDLSSNGSSALSGFLNLDSSLLLKNRNVREQSNESDTYRQLLEKLHISPSVCKEIYSRRFSQHFYGKAMIERFVHKWTKGKG